MKQLISQVIPVALNICVVCKNIWMLIGDANIAADLMMFESQSRSTALEPWLRAVNCLSVAEHCKTKLR
jgi:hypothetical protein